VPRRFGLTFNQYRTGVSIVSTPQENEEAKKIRALLDQLGGNRQKTAQALGLSRTTLWRKMKKYGLL